MQSPWKFAEPPWWPGPLIESHLNIEKKLKEKNAFIQQACIKLIKSDSKGIYNVTKELYVK